MNDKNQKYDIAHLSDSSLSKLRQYEEELCSLTNDKIVLVAYENKHSDK